MKDNLKGVGIWGQRHYQYLKETKPSVIGVMRLNGNLIRKKSNNETFALVPFLGFGAMLSLII